MNISAECSMRYPSRRFGLQHAAQPVTCFKQSDARLRVELAQSLRRRHAGNPAADYRELSLQVCLTVHRWNLHGSRGENEWVHDGHQAKAGHSTTDVGSFEQKDAEKTKARLPLSPW